MCDAAVATSAYTRSGRVLFAKNSDRKQGECQPFVQFPAAHHAQGAELECTHVVIPQVRDTHRVMGHQPWWVWGFEHGVNEHGLVIGNLAVFSREAPEEKPGLIGMDLVRLALERAANAEEAIGVIARLLETHGQGGAALAPDGSGYHNSFLLADPKAAWILETTGRRHAARPATRDALSNHFCLGSDWTEASPDLESFARHSGWWIDDGPVDVAAAFRNEHVPGRLSDPRQRRALELLGASEKHDVGSMQALLRDHGEGGLAPPVGATLEEERYFTLCMHSEPVGTTTASLVAEIPEDPQAIWPVWVSFSTPCTSLFLPLYLEGAIPSALARGGRLPSDDSAWWVFERLREAASQDFAKHAPEIRAAWQPVEAKIEEERPGVEAGAAAAKQAGRAHEAALLLSDFMNRNASAALAVGRELAKRIG